MSVNSGDLEKLLAELISIKTYRRNPEIVNFLKKALKDNGWKNVRESGGNVWGSIGSGGIKIVYDIHSDTIRAGSPAWKTDPFKAVVKSGRIYGRGAVDDKGPLAAAIFAGNFIKPAAGYKVYLLASDREEIDEGYGCRIFIAKEKIKPDYAVISEPSGLKLAVGQRGRTEFYLNAAGIPAHGSTPEKGKNAVYIINEAVNKIKKIKFKRVPPFSNTIVTPTVLSSQGDGINALPSSCGLYLDVRINHKDRAEDIRKKILKTIPPGISVKTGRVCKAWLLKDRVLLKASRQAYKKVFGSAPEPYYWGFCTNGSEYIKYGIPVVGFGPGDPGMAHRDNEMIKFSDVEKAVGFFAVLPEHIGSVK